MMNDAPPAQASAIQRSASSIPHSIFPASGPGPLTPDLFVPGIEILAAARQVGEIELIAGKIKRLLVDGEARPGEIAVVFRSLDDVGGAGGRGLWPVGSSSAVRVGAIVRSLAGAAGPGRLAAIGPRRLAVRSTTGRVGEQLLPARRTPARRHGGIGTDDSSVADSPRAPTTDAAASIVGRNAASGLRAMSGAWPALDALPEQATLPEWAKAWRRLAEDTGLLQAIDGVTEATSESLPSPSSLALSDRRAWNRLMEVLAAGDTLAAWLQRRPPELDRRAAVEALLDILRSERVGHAGDESGYVRVLSASSVRSLRIPYLFLAGLSEKVFPPPDREDRLYSEAEYARLIDAGLPLVARSRTHARRDAVVLRGDHAGRQAAVPELPGARRIGATAAAQPVLARGRAGVRARRRFLASSGPISARSRRTTSRSAKPSFASRRWPRRWRATWRCWRD